MRLTLKIITNQGYLLYLGSPVQCRPSPSPVLEGNDFADEECVCAVDCAEDSNGARNGCQSTTPCPIHFKLRDNCRSGRSLQQMLEVFTIRFKLHFRFPIFYRRLAYFY